MMRGMIHQKMLSSFLFLCVSVAVLSVFLRVSMRVVVACCVCMYLLSVVVYACGGRILSVTNSNKS